jgi:Cd2+/Zn2+-exporting ATPase
MDCASEEGEIRHALANIPGLRSLSFQLAARTIAIDAPAESISQALEAIRKAGFKPVPLAVSGDEDESDNHRNTARIATRWICSI